MVDGLYAVRHSRFDQWPFILLADMESAIECVISMHPEMDVDDQMGLIKRIPCFSSYKVFEEVPYGR